MDSPFNRSPLAIAGMAVRLPGARNLDEFWRLLLDQRHAIGKLPLSRLDRGLYYQAGAPVPGKTYSDIGGVVPDEELDPGRLGLEEGDLSRSHAAHLWFLHTCLSALDDAQIHPETLAGRRIGIFVGHARVSLQFAELMYAAGMDSMAEEISHLTGPAHLGEGAGRKALEALVEQTQQPFLRWTRDLPVADASWPARLAALRLQTTGHYMAVDAACASSFAALNLAARAIHSGEIEAAIVGGCSYNRWETLVLFSQAHALSPAGSFPFDARGDGFVVSDGYAAIFIEPLERARREGHRVLGLIQGIGASCDGRGKALWAPLQEGQEAAMRRAYRPGLAPDSIHAIEAHATGTQLGDATEIRAVSEVFRRGDGSRIPLTAVKGNIGHTVETAGLAGLIKMVLCMRHGVLCPTANYSLGSASRLVDWERAPVRVVEKPEPWPEPCAGQMRAAVNAFGIGGINYHVVVEGPPPHPASAARRKSDAIRTTGRKRQPDRFPDLRGEAVAVVGMGVVLPGIPDMGEFLKRCDRPAAFSDIGAERPRPALSKPWAKPWAARGSNGSGPAGRLDGWQFDWVQYRISPREVRESDPLRFMLIDAVGQALRQAGCLNLTPAERRQTAVYAGTIFGGDFISGLNIGLRLARLERDLKGHLEAAGVSAASAEQTAQEARSKLLQDYRLTDEWGSFSSSTLASRISKVFDFMGPCCAVDAEEASGLAALEAAIGALCQGECDLAVCCAGQRSLHPLRLLDYDMRDRMGGNGHADFRPADGAVALVLKREWDIRDSGSALAVLKDLRSSASAAGPWSALCDSAGAVRLRGNPPPLLVECFAAGRQGRETDEDRALRPATTSAPGRISATRLFGMTQGASGLVGLVHLLAAAEKRAPNEFPVAAALNSVGLRGLAYHLRLEVPGMRASVPPPQPTQAPAAAAAPLIPYARTRQVPEAIPAGIVHFDATLPRRRKEAGVEPVPAPDPPVRREEENPRAEENPKVLEIEQILAGTISDQTGYPASEISADQNLEADLGIDSISKAQLLGALRDRYEASSSLQPTGFVDLGNLVTLRDMARFLHGVVGEASLTRRPEGQAALPAPDEKPAVGRTAAVPERPNGLAATPEEMKAVRSRWILRCEPEPGLPAGAVRPLPTLILGQGGVVRKLAELLAGAGEAVLQFDIEDGGWQQAVAAQGAPGRLILVASDLPLLSRGAAARRRALERHAVLPLLAVQRWFQAVKHTGGLEQSELFAVTRMGGDFGFSPTRDMQPAGGALGGLCKAIGKEASGMRVRIVDAPPAEPDSAVAGYVFRELGERDDSIEAGYARGRRFGIRLIGRSLPEGRDGGHAAAALGDDGCWIVSGGGRGITALCARELASRYGVHLHLLGTTPLGATGKDTRHADPQKQRELEASLEAYARSGVKFTYHCVDVADAAGLARVLSLIRRSGKPIRGILHGAGVEAAASLPKKKAEQVRATFYSKVLGMQNLLSLTSRDPVQAVIGFGSISGRFGWHGHADYSSASELLAKLLSFHRRTNGAACATFHWPPWGEVGMAMRPESRIVLETLGSMPPGEGVAHFMREVAAGLPEAEVVILESRELTQDSRHVHDPGSGDARLGGVARPALLEGLLDSRAGSLTFELKLRPTDPFFTDHRYEFRPLLPAAVSLEALSEAALFQAQPGQCFTMENVSLHAGVRGHPSRDLLLRVSVENSSDGWQARLRGESITRQRRIGDPDRCFASARIRAGVPATPPPAACPPPAVAMSVVPYAEHPSQEEPKRVYYGPSLRTLRRFGAGGEADWGELVAARPDVLRPDAPAAHWRIPAALLDGCLLACGISVLHHFGAYTLPTAIERLVVLGHPEPECRCVLRLRIAGRKADRWLFDFILHTAAGDPLLWASGCRMTLTGMAKNAGLQAAITMSGAGEDRIA